MEITAGCMFAKGAVALCVIRFECNVGNKFLLVRLPWQLFALWSIRLRSGCVASNLMRSCFFFSVYFCAACFCEFSVFNSTPCTLAWPLAIYTFRCQLLSALFSSNNYAFCAMYYSILGTFSCSCCNLICPLRCCANVDYFVTNFISDNPLARYSLREANSFFMFDCAVCNSFTASSKPLSSCTSNVEMFLSLASSAVLLYKLCVKLSFSIASCRRSIKWKLAPVTARCRHCIWVCLIALVVTSHCVRYLSNCANCDCSLRAKYARST